MRRCLPLLALLSVGMSAASGSFQVRYFQPADPWYGGLSADLNLRTELLGGTLDSRLSVSGLEQQSLSATYTQNRTVILAQYDGSQTLYGAGLKSDLTALLFVQQGFEGEALRQLSLTALYTASQTPTYQYRVLSADLNAGGNLTPEWSWTLGGGLTSSDTGTSSAYTAGTLSERVRAGLSGRFGTERPTTVQVQGSWGGSQSSSLASDGTSAPGAASSRFGVNASGNAPISEAETLGGSARIDSSGGYGVDLTLSSTRLPDWTLTAGGTLYGQLDSTDALGNPVAGTPAVSGWNVSATSPPQPWGLRFTYAGSGGASPTQQLDAEVQYQKGQLGVHLGGGVTLRPLTSGGEWQPGYRVSAGISFQTAPPPAPAAGSPPAEIGQTLGAQLRLSASSLPALNPDGTVRSGYGGALSGNLNYSDGPYTLNFNSSLNYSGLDVDQPWSGEVGLQGLYRFSDALQLNASVRFRPAYVSSFQAGLGLKYTF